VAEFCFAEQRRELFAECCLRGWHAACLDFPRHDGLPRAREVPDELRGEVCCIDNEFAYQALIAFAWGTGYHATERATSSERERFAMAMTLKSMSRAEGMALLRQVMASSQNGQTFIEKAYAQLAALPMFA